MSKGTERMRPAAPSPAHTDEQMASLIHALVRASCGGLPSLKRNLTSGWRRVESSRALSGRAYLSGRSRLQPMRRAGIARCTPARLLAAVPSWTIGIGEPEVTRRPKVTQSRNRAAPFDYLRVSCGEHLRNKATLVR